VFGRDVCRDGARVHHPLLGLGVADEVEKPTEESDPITAAQPETSGVRAERLRECPDVVVYPSKRVGYELANGLRILAVGKEIRSNPGGSRYRQPPEDDPLAFVELAAVNADVGTPHLPPCRKSELVNVGGQMADPVHGRRGPMGHDSLIRLPLPDRSLRCELEPGRAKRDMVRYGRPGKAVHRGSRAFEGTVPDQTLECGRRDPCALAWRRVTKPHCSSARLASLLSVDARGMAAL
jgi:hypothetical protein